jgi:hypothetical protein
MTEKEENEIDWSLTTWKGSRRLQHERWRSLSFAEKLACIEEMNESSAEMMGKSIPQMAEEQRQRDTRLGRRGL